MNLVILAVRNFIDLNTLKLDYNLNFDPLSPALSKYEGGIKIL